LSAIADIVTLLNSSGISAEFHGKFIDLVMQHGIEQIEILRNSMEIPRNSTETSYERQLRKDRDRKRIPRNSTESAETKNADILTYLSSSEETLKKERKKESSGIRARDASTVPDDWPSDFGDVFWKAYPRKEEKIAAMKKLAILRKSGIVTFADLMAGVDRYCSVKREPQFIKQPTVWLNKGCWADETQTGARSGERSGNTRSSGHDAIFAAFARKAGEIPRDGPMAGAAGEDEFPNGDGSDHRTTGGASGASTGPHEAYNGRASFGLGVLEGEIIPPDKPPAGVPRSRQQH